jgi:hypothetical protein
MTSRPAGSCIEEGAIVSDFRGFKNRDTLFKFGNGHVYRQNEYRYAYHYAYRPTAWVIDGRNGVELHVEGMDESVSVKRVR